VGITTRDPLLIIESSPVLALLPREKIRTLAAVAKFETCEQRTLLEAEGQTIGYFRYVIEGSVDLTATTADGKVSAIPVFPGTWATWMACMNDAPIPFDMWSSRSAIYLAVPRRAVRAAVSAHPEALLQVIEHAGAIQRALMAWVMNVSLQSPEKRIAFLLLQTSQGSWMTPETGGVAAITQEQIGNLGLGSRQRVGRLLRNLEQLRLIEIRYGAVYVPSWEKLNAYVFH
jgi:CRP-like cAMP-binding protein